MKVALFGGTGFIGSYIRDELLRNGHKPSLLVHPGSMKRTGSTGMTTVVAGNIEDTSSVRKTLEGCDAAIYCIGIIREFKSRGITFEKLHYRGAAHVIDTAHELGVRRFILMSANGVRPDGTSYQRTKYLAEEHVRVSELDWTIFRPSVVFGDPRGRNEFCTDIHERIVRPPLPVPLFFAGMNPLKAGGFPLSPVHVSDVAGAFVRALHTPESIGKTYSLGGPDTITWKELIQTIARASGRSKLAVPVPAAFVSVAAMLFDRFPFFPVTRDQIVMLLEGNTCDATAFDTFGITPLPFGTETLTYLAAR